MKGKLLDDVSVQEMMELRSEGLSNRQIAQRLGVCYDTVLKYLGRAGFRAPVQYKAEKEVKPEIPPPVMIGCLKVISTVATLQGSICRITL